MTAETLTAREKTKRRSRKKTMNFEVIDNLFQAVLLGVMSAAALAAGLRRGSRKCMILAFAYACFTMGTLYYLLYIVIIGNNPKVFYVAEASWLASYLFFLSLQIMRCDGMKVRLRPLPLIPAAGVGVSIVLCGIFGPSVIMSVLFALTAGGVLYLSIFRLAGGGKNKYTDAVMIASVVLQVALYDISDFTHDYTRFCPYFAVDILLTLTLSALLPVTLVEERRV